MHSSLQLKRRGSETTSHDDGLFRRHKLEDNAATSYYSIAIEFSVLYHIIHTTKPLEPRQSIMSGEIRTIARALRSASHNTLPNGDLSFLEVQGRRLIEKIYDYDYLKDQRMVANGLRENSTAAYALAKDSVSTSNCMQAALL